MWVPRTEQEVARWHEITRQDARSHGLWIAVLVGVAVVVFSSAGLYYTRAGILLTRNRLLDGSWRRLILSGIFVAPISYWIYRSESRKELSKATRRTICPDCGRAGEEPVGTACGECGQALVPQSTMKWVDEA
ncbi:hypothetical protein [Aquisphaera insulae]|uniref:hypothetical protein n=1 Tax=Aquisphaera insulae TaxID=2712864 RepID=UPI0013ED0B2D|nr:hypothetical protein [Aquisphaera insulae]